ncbi:hypothetical protein [Candidatus Venteria ishoeyi]|uniref:Uncharacterized protein n=1 Tax=Candidatus Venteria ishoeyi TaxID=1899563 RepID=A0A1H6FFH0_9GAMM|nr:hypothetical protein [Candidatus Venteria ishoeyi]MDM8545061.1 hypothetical protein [Candidatus Venteria ishoeyi]SEH07916.1 Uncharacterised protein [Candidatus Venteria ishoeyi]
MAKYNTNRRNHPGNKFQSAQKPANGKQLNGLDVRLAADLTELFPATRSVNKDFKLLIRVKPYKK